MSTSREVGQAENKRREGRQKEGSRKVTYPEDTSHTLIVLSLLAETNRSPSCVKRTVEILWSCPCNVLIFLYSFAVSHNFIVKSVEHVTEISPSPHSSQIAESQHLTVFGQTHP